MSKSRHAKTKAAGAAIGLNRYGKQFGQKPEFVDTNNRQMRRLKNGGKQ